MVSACKHYYQMIQILIKLDTNLAPFDPKIRPRRLQVASKILQDGPSSTCINSGARNLGPTRRRHKIFQISPHFPISRPPRKNKSPAV